MHMVNLLLSAERHRRLVAWLLVTTTIVLGLGLARVRVETGVLDWLPRRNPHVVAFRQLFEYLPGTVNQELIWLELDPGKAETLGVTSITDPVSLFAQEELLHHLKGSVPEIQGEFGVLAVLRMARGLLPGGDPAAPLPRDPDLAARLWKAISQFAPARDMVQPLIAADGRGTICSVLLEAPPLSGRARALGQKLTAALEAYRQDPAKEYDLFRDAYLIPVGLSSGTAGMDSALRRDVLILTPCAAVFLLLVLRLLLGNWRRLLPVLGVLTAGTVWTLGLLGWCGTPLSVVTIALVPLILGCGIDYAILISVEALDHRAAGLSPRAVLKGVAGRSAVAVFLTTLTTVAGLLALIPSDSPGMRALGFHAAFGMAALGLLSIVVVPVFLLPALPATAGAREGVAWLGAAVAAAARGARRRRAAALGLWIVLSVTAVALVRTPVVSMDLLEGNYPSDAPISRSARTMREQCGGAFPETIIAYGDMSDPRALHLLRRIKTRIVASPVLGRTFTAVGVPDILTLARARSLFRFPLGGAYTNRDAIRQAVGELYQSPAWAPLVRTVVDQDMQVGVLLLLGGDAGTELHAVRRIWDELDAIIAEESRPDDPVTVSFLGYRTIAYLFTTYSWRWLRVTATVSLTVVLLLTAIFIRRARAVLLVALLVGTSSLWWLGLLQLPGIYLSVFLLFPLVFAMCIGSDYGLHLLCSYRAIESAGETAHRHDRVWATTGRAIAVAAFTDAAVFLMYATMELVSGSQVMQAVALAVVAVFLSTLVLVPALKR